MNSSICIFKDLLFSIPVLFNVNLEYELVKLTAEWIYKF